MPAHQRVRVWIAQNYQKPAIDQEWLADCSEWISSELGLDPERDFDNFIQHVEAQLLQSKLADSTVPGSGIDPVLVASNPNPARPRPSSVRGRRTAHRVAQVPRQRKTTGPIPLLVEIMSITEIAHSAFSLLNTHQTRLDRADLGLAQEENDEQYRNEDEGPVPKFPRGMLKFELSDGSTTLRAIEFRSLPQLELGTTPLGYKIFLKSTPVRNGIAFLEPANVILKGYRTEDHDVNSDQVFLRSLRKRLGRPDPPEALAPRANPPAQPEPIQPLRQHQLPLVAKPPSPPADIDDMYVDDDVDPDVLREMANQIDEEIDAQRNQRAGTRVPQPTRPPTSTVGSNLMQILSLHTKTESSSIKASAPSAATTSPYFTTKLSNSKNIPGIGLSPRPALPPHLESDLDRDVDDSASSKLPVKAQGSTTAKLPSAVSAEHDTASEKPPSPPDPYDDIAFDMDVDDEFFEQVGKIEQGALATSAHKTGMGKAKSTGSEATMFRSRPSAAPGRKSASSSASGTNHLAIYPVSCSGAESSTRMQSSTKKATSASSVTGSMESAMPRSTQSTGQHLSRDPSLHIISSSEDEGSGAPRMVPQRRKRRQGDVVLESDVIDVLD
ncbi:hypothetical protein JVU11DRAFT_4102 [Chiua virens]|nr:hypothetical protein JVU11DRAFT_4102 [Chiua virens]